MTTAVQNSIPVATNVLDLIARTGPVSAVSLSRAAGLECEQAAEWLERQSANGYLHCDEVTGLYAPWCPLRRTY